MQSLPEWEASLEREALLEQARALRAWLARTDSLIVNILVPLLRMTPEELAVEAALLAAEEEEERLEAAEVAAAADAEAEAEAVTEFSFVEEGEEENE